MNMAKKMVMSKKKAIQGLRPSIETPQLERVELYGWRRHGRHIADRFGRIVLALCSGIDPAVADAVCERINSVTIPVPAPVPATDAVNHPPHYTAHPSGVECIVIAEAFNFNVGNAIKYLWRAGLKGDQVEDLKKARWYVDREIKRVEHKRAR